MNINEIAKPAGTTPNGGMERVKELYLKRLQKSFLYPLIAPILLFAAFAICMQSPLNPWGSGVSEQDSSVFRYVAAVMENGGTPYKDTFDHKGPLLYLINYLGNLISSRGVWFLEVAFLWAALFFLYRTARLSSGRFMACLLTVCGFYPIYNYFEGGNFTEEYALPFLAASLFWFLDYFLNRRISRGRLFFCGACFGAVLMLRPNMISLWIVFGIAVVAEGLRQEKRILWNFIVYFLLGAACAVLPFLIWLFIKGAFGDFVQAYLIFNLKYSSTGKASLAAQAGMMLYWCCSCPFLISAVCMVFLIGKEKNHFLNITYAIGMLLTIAFLSVSGRHYDHYAMILFPFYIYPLSCFAGILIKKERRESTAAVFCMILLLLSAQNWQESLLGMDVISGAIEADAADLDDETQEVVDLILKNTDEDDRIQVIGSDDFLYLASGRLSASKYSYQTPIAFVDEAVKNEFLEDMERTKPKIVILQNRKSKKQRSLFQIQDEYELLLTTEDHLCVYRRKDA